MDTTVGQKLICSEIQNFFCFVSKFSGRNLRQQTHTRAPSLDVGRFSSGFRTKPQHQPSPFQVDGFYSRAKQRPHAPFKRSETTTTNRTSSSSSAPPLSQAKGVTKHFQQQKKPRKQGGGFIAAQRPERPPAAPAVVAVAAVHPAGRPCCDPS